MRSERKRWASAFAAAAATGLCVAAGGTPPAPAPPPAKAGFMEQVRANFAKWDADHDGVLSTAEVERALDDPAVTGPAAAAAATLRRDMYAYDLGAITVDCLQAAVDAPAGTTPKPPPLATTYAAAVKKIAGTRRAVFVSGSPKVERLGQGRLGDCFLIAAVGTMAAGQPDRLKAMVTERPDGQVSVHFGDGRTVTLPPPTDGEIVIGSGTLNDGVWGCVFEKAIGHVLLDRQRHGGKSVTPFQVIGGGGSPHVPLGILTGHGCRRVGCEDFQKAGKLDAAARQTRLDAVRDDLSAAFKAGKLVVGGTGGTDSGEAVVPGLYFDHSYGVLGYDRKTDLVTFWNPMGNRFTPAGPAGLANGYPTAHGRFDCPLAEAVMWFGSFSIETDEPAGK